MADNHDSATTVTDDVAIPPEGGHERDKDLAQIVSDLEARMTAERRDEQAKDTVETASTDSGSEGAHDDVESDPGEGADSRTDWADEGGATGTGPATDS